MQVVGVTTQQEFWVATRERKFKINEILIIEDPDQGTLQGEVVETQSYNRFIPMAGEKGIVDKGVLESLRLIGYNVDQEEINLSRVRLLKEAYYPVKTGAIVRAPVFDEVKDLLVKTTPDTGLVLGVIKGTENLEASMDNNLKNIALLHDGEKVCPQLGIPFAFPIRLMQQYPHIGIFGGSGSGKSFGLRVLLEELMKLQVPCLLFDPHFEMDFTQQADGIPADYAKEFSNSFVTLQVGQQVGVNFEKLETRGLVNLLKASSGEQSFSDAMANAVDALHKKSDSYFSFRNRVEDLKEALTLGRQRIEKKLSEDTTSRAEIDKFERYLEYINQYGSLFPSTVQGVLWRLDRLYRSGIFTQHIQPIIDGLKQRKLIVIQGPIWLLQVFAAYVLNLTYQKRREFKDAEQRGQSAEKFPPFIVITDEAHNFVPKGYEASTKAVIKEIAQEGRKYGVFLVLATQRPTLLDETVTAQLNTKFIFRTVRSSDIATIKEETDLSPEEAKRLPFLTSGDTFISSAILGRTIAVRIRAAKTTSSHAANPFDELIEMAEQREEVLFNLIKDKLPIGDHNLSSVLPEINRRLEAEMALEIGTLKNCLEQFALTGKVIKEKTPFGSVYKEAKIS